jgi:eukaryotic-like serine/threonine-protein kinase
MHEAGGNVRSTGDEASPTRDRLDSWKEIAAYMGRGVTTVQRWEQEEGLPIHRLPHASRGSVFALRPELDAWRRARATLPPPPAFPARPTDTAGGAPRRAVSPVTIGGGLLLVAAIGWGLSAARRLDRADDRPLSEARSSPRPLANDSDGELSPSLSPDGAQVVYGWERAADGIGLYIKPVTGGPPRRVPVGPDVRFEESPHPTWSPRGETIAFLAYEAPQMYGLFLIAPGGGAPRRLTSMSGIGLCWHPDGGSLGFIDRLSTGDPFSVFLLSLATGERRRLTAPPLAAFGDTHCAISPDGQRLAVVRYDTRHASDVFVVDDPAMAGMATTRTPDSPAIRASDGARRLTSDLPGLDGIAWTPDGSSVVVGSHRGLWNVPVAPASSGRAGRPVLVAGFEGGTGSPSFARSRSGSVRLAYHYEQRDVNIRRWQAPGDPTRELARARVGSDATIPLRSASTWWDDAPALSPDGRQVAFTSNRTGTTEIWTADIDGALARQVTSHGPVVLAPQWSPDGRRLAFTRQVGGDRDIYVIDADSSRSTRLTWEPTQEDNASWSRDGRSIYFRSDRGGIGRIWKMSANGGQAVRMTAGAGSQAFESPDARQIYFVRSSDQPGLWVMPIGGGAETLVARAVREGLWGVTDRGIAFIDRTNLRAPEGLPIRFYDLATRATTTAAMITMAHDVTAGFAIARDGRSALFTTVDHVQHDLMLIDSWRP